MFRVDSVKLSWESEFSNLKFQTSKTRVPMRISNWILLNKIYNHLGDKNLRKIRMFKRPVATLELPEYKIKEFHTKGYIYCEDVDPKVLSSEVGISEKEWAELTESIQTKTALDILHEEYFSSNIVTFSKNIDEILGGGVPLKLITEFCGLPGSGKTQFCLQLGVSVQLPECFGGLSGHAVFIDTSWGFSKERFLELIKGRIRHCTNVTKRHNSPEMTESLNQCTEYNLMSGLHYLRATKFLELLSTLHALRELLKRNYPIKLVIIDSITKPFKICDLEYFDRIKILYSLLSEMQELAQIHNFAIVLTNDFTTKFDENGVSYVAPSLGDSYSHRVNNRVILKRISDTDFCAILEKSVIMPKVSVKYRIGSRGIHDITQD